MFYPSNIYAISNCNFKSNNAVYQTYLFGYQGNCIDFEFEDNLRKQANLLDQFCKLQIVDYFSILKFADLPCQICLSLHHGELSF